MPIQVQCSECDEGFSVPDKASGKATRCPYCEARVRVPAKSASRGRKRPAKQAPREEFDVTDDDFLGQLDLRAAEDQKTRVCPKCGRVMADDLDVCSKCGVDVETGQLTHEERRKRSLKGPDPEKFFAKIWSEPWEFLGNNIMFPVRSSIYFLVTLLLFCGCIWMFNYSYNPPPKWFWGFCALVAITVGPGWFWHLTIRIIDITLLKKKQLDKTPFDFFLCSALGIKIFNWVTIFTFGLPVIGFVLIMQEMVVVGWTIIGLSLLFCVPMLPSVMTHMTMPVTYRGWLSPVIVPTFFRTATASMICGAQFLIGISPLLLGAGLIVGIWGNDLDTYYNELNFNGYVREAAAAPDWKPPKVDTVTQQPAANNEDGEDADDEVVIVVEKPPEEETDPKFGDPHFWFRKAEPKVLNHASLIGPGIVGGLMAILTGFTMFYAMRGMGMFAFYFNRDLDLIVMEKEVEWNPKARKTNEWGEEIKNPLEPYFGLIGTILFYVVGNIILYFATGGEYILLPGFKGK